jgi:hypothetical protein
MIELASDLNQGAQQRAYLLGSMVELASDLNQGAQKIGFLSSFPPFCLKTEEESSFRNVVLLYFMI